MWQFYDLKYLDKKIIPIVTILWPPKYLEKNCSRIYFHSLQYNKTRTKLEKWIKLIRTSYVAGYCGAR